MAGFVVSTRSTVLLNTTKRLDFRKFQISFFDPWCLFFLFPFFQDFVTFRPDAFIMLVSGDFLNCGDYVKETHFKDVSTLFFRIVPFSRVRTKTN